MGPQEASIVEHDALPPRPLDRPGAENAFLGHEDGSTLRDARLEDVELDRIEDNPFQPRHRIEPAELAALASSIRHLGIIEPLVGRLHPTKPGFIQLAAGARRRAAAAMAGLVDVPVVVRDLDDKAMRLFALAENIHRLDLADVEREAAYANLWEEVYRPMPPRAPGDKHLDLMAQELGLNRVTVGDVLRAHEARKVLGEGAPHLSTQDASVLAPLARDDPASARALAAARIAGRLTADGLAKLAPRIRALPADRRGASLERWAPRAAARGRATEAPPRVLPSGPVEDPPLRQLGLLLQSVRGLAARSARESYRDEEERQQAIDILLEVQRILDGELDVLMQDGPGRHRRE